MENDTARDILCWLQQRLGENKKDLCADRLLEKPSSKRVLISLDTSTRMASQAIFSAKLHYPPFSSTNQGRGYHATSTTFANPLSLLLLLLRCLDLSLDSTSPFTLPSLSSAPSEPFRHISAKRIVHSPRCCPIFESQFIVTAATTTTVHLCCSSAAIAAGAVISASPLLPSAQLPPSLLPSPLLLLPSPNRLELLFSTHWFASLSSLKYFS